ncbi:alpha/beta fold hydrolase [Oceanicella actignis]|uniref:alpha/beta fold hydrolase n=1 Tax=Oceanicella actignis TaxID=1189325 RepID=UPI0011E73115|nr:alpha/beta fold hydrolase [Oceanicella actignis]TYO85391.1 pimeloyl-ACP methyl ester carboxylesterase [Oceanicella actignis]
MTLLAFIAAALIGAGAVMAAGGAAYTARLSRAIAAAHPPCGRWREVRGGRIHFIERGRPDGPALVLIHGLGGNLHNFNRMIPLLERDFRVIALDRPGSGWSERRSDRLAALPEQARMIAEFLRAEGVARPVLVGHSLGGAVALALALEHPEQVGALALLAPLTHPIRRPPAAFRVLACGRPWARRAAARLFAPPIGEAVLPGMLRAVFAPEPVPPEFETEGAVRLALRPAAAAAAAADLVHVVDVAALAPRYGALRAPGGVLFGGGDTLLDPQAQGEALARAAPGIHCRVLFGRGHMLPWTCPEACAALAAEAAAMARMA